MDALLLGHLDSKGFEVTNRCRLCGHDGETFAHVVSHIPDANRLAPTVRRSLSKLKRMEAKLHPLNEN